MNIWDKVKEGIDKAGKAASEAIDEGKTRIDAYRAREQADKAAEALGYAFFRAMEAGEEVESESRTRLMQSLRERDTEARRLETLLANEGTAKPDTPPPPPPAAPDAAAPPPASPPPPAAAAAPPAGFNSDTSAQG